MNTSWITLYPHWYVRERQSLARHYPQLRVNEAALEGGNLQLFGELEVRPPAGTVKHPVWVIYPDSTPFEPPVVFPLESLPELGADGAPRKKTKARVFDHRHQMPAGNLCLFQRDTRGTPGGDLIRGIDALRRAERWFLGYHTGHWPPDSVESELEAHFHHLTDVLLGDTFYSEALTGCGRFFAVRDFRRIVEGRFEGISPFIVTALIEEGPVCKYLDARKDLGAVYPWIQNDHWDPARALRGRV